MNINVYINVQNCTEIPLSNEQLAVSVNIYKSTSLGFTWSLDTFDALAGLAA